MRVAFELNVSVFANDAHTWHKVLVIGENVPIARVFDITRDLLFGQDTLVLSLAQTLGDGAPVRIVWDSTAAHDLLIKSDATVSVDFNAGIVLVNGNDYSFGSIVDVYDEDDELRDEFITHLQGDGVVQDKFIQAIAAAIRAVRNQRYVTDDLFAIEVVSMLAFRISDACAGNMDQFDVTRFLLDCGE